MNKKYLLGTLLFLTLFLTGCGIDKISDIKSETYIGQTVTVKGTVENTIKLGELSGFTLSDGEDSIFISSGNLPSEGSNQKVKGILRKNLLGHYIEMN